MARPLRIEYPGAWYHVMNRGLNRRAIFCTDEQRLYFLSLLASTTERFNAEWHAYCLMGNHYHLMLRTPEGNMQRIMRQVNGVYTQYFNRVEGRDGPLFRGRYKAILVDGQSYWAQLSRYIHRNPLEAGMVAKLEDYQWSSYPVYIGAKTGPDWLVTDYILNSMAQHNPHLHYCTFVEIGVDRELREFYAAARQRPILGDDEFRETVLGSRPSTPDVPELREARTRPDAQAIIDYVAKRRGTDPETIRHPADNRRAGNAARGIAMMLCQDVADMRLREVAEQFGLKHYASAASCIRQARRRVAGDKALLQFYQEAKFDLACVAESGS